MAEILEPGTNVEVRNRFDSEWTNGFVVVGHDQEGYRVRRLTDDSELPFAFGANELRRERPKKNDMWWI